MKLGNSILFLLVLGLSQLSLAQVLMPPLNINKSPEQMTHESQVAREFFQQVRGTHSAPVKMDLVKYQTPVRSQGQRGSCVAFATTALVESMLKIKTGQDNDLSEQYAYWASKAIDHIVPNSDGSIPLRFMKSVEKNGIPAETTWPYDATPWYNDPNHPDCYKAGQANPDHVPTQCVTNGDAPAAAINAPKAKITNSHAVPSSAESIMGFVQNGVPVEVGADVYDKAWSYSNKTSPGYLSGTVTMPPPGDKVIGGHAFLIVGYDSTAKVFLFKNSWGTNRWASKSPVPGYGTIPFDYIAKYAEGYVAKIP